MSRVTYHCTDPEAVITREADQLVVATTVPHAKRVMLSPGSPDLVPVVVIDFATGYAAAADDPHSIGAGREALRQLTATKQAPLDDVDLDILTVLKEHEGR